MESLILLIIRYIAEKTLLKSKVYLENRSIINKIRKKT
jgi:hypothetical protein